MRCIAAFALGPFALAVGACVVGQKRPLPPEVAAVQTSDEQPYSEVGESPPVHPDELQVSHLFSERVDLGLLPTTLVDIGVDERSDYTSYAACPHSGGPCVHGTTVNGLVQRSDLPSGPLRLSARSCLRQLLSSSPAPAACGRNAESFFIQGNVPVSSLQKLWVTRFELEERLRGYAFPIQAAFRRYLEVRGEGPEDREHTRFTTLVRNHVRLGPDYLGEVLVSPQYDELRAELQRSSDEVLRASLALAGRYYQAHRDADSPAAEKASPGAGAEPPQAWTHDGRTIMLLASVEVGLAIGSLVSSVAADGVAQAEKEKITQIKKNHRYNRLKFRQDLLVEGVPWPGAADVDPAKYLAAKKELQVHKSRLDTAETISRRAGLFGAVVGIAGLIVALLETTPQLAGPSEGSLSWLLAELAKHELAIAETRQQLARVEQAIRAELATSQAK